MGEEDEDGGWRRTMSWSERWGGLAGASGQERWGGLPPQRAWAGSLIRLAPMEMSQEQEAFPLHPRLNFAGMWRLPTVGRG